jgi:UDP-glucose 4-epimerase
MRILVTGSEGSLAQSVIPYFQEKGHEIIGVDNFCRHKRKSRKRGYVFYEKDLTDTASAKFLMKRHKMEVVFHAAALVYGVVGFHKKPADIIADNNLMTLNILKNGRGSIKKFIYISSSMVYEKCKTWPHQEADADSSVVMSTSYGFSKYVGERIAKAFHEQYGTTYTIWRPFNIITPFEHPEAEGFSHVFTDFIHKILVLQEESLKILGDGNQVRCFTNIFDVAQALSRFSLDKRSDNGVFNVANKEPVSMKRLAHHIVELGKEFRILKGAYRLRYAHLPIYGDDVRKRIPDVRKMENVFGWKAKIKLRQSLEQCIRYLLSQGSLRVEG